VEHVISLAVCLVSDLGQNITMPLNNQTTYSGHGKAKPGVGVSLVVTLYNYEQYLENALQSVFQQTHPNLELIIVDDGSTDGSVRVASKWLQENSKRFARAILLCHTKNSGVVQARNTAFESASNDYVFVLDADDEIHPTAISKLLAACLSADAQAAYSQIELFGAATGITGGPWKPSAFEKDNYVAATALVKKSAWRDVGGYTQPAEIQGWEDYDFWCKFVEHGFRGEFVPELLCRYRIHKSSMSRTTNKLKLEQLKVGMKRRHPWLKVDEPPTVRDRLGYWYWLFLVRLKLARHALKRICKIV
jgi:glycosyltransferase involved in cell wall biosynthesis